MIENNVSNTTGRSIALFFSTRYGLYKKNGKTKHGGIIVVLIVETLLYI